MRVQVEDLARKHLIDIYYYNYRYSLKNAIETSEKILSQIDNLEYFPYIGRHIPKIKDKHFRELICRKNRNSYRIVYYISKSSDIVYIIHISNSKQNFNRILKINNYFKKYSDI